MLKQISNMYNTFSSLRGSLIVDDIQNVPPCYVKQPKGGDIIIQIDSITGEPIPDLFHERLAENRLSACPSYVYPPEYGTYPRETYPRETICNEREPLLYKNDNIWKATLILVLVAIIMLLFMWLPMYIN